MCNRPGRRPVWSQRRMNLAKLQETLLAAARANPPSDRVPYAFEKRIMARLAARPELDAWTVWARMLWRAATPCLGVTVLLVGLAFMTGGLQGNQVSLGEGLEATGTLSVVLEVVRVSVELVEDLL